MTSETSYVPAAQRNELTPEERAFFRVGADQAVQVIDASNGQHVARSEDNAVTVAHAALIQSVAMGIVFGVVSLALVLIAWWTLRLDFGLALAGGLVVWGVITLYFLERNQEISLWHSPSGIAHHEIDARESVAHHAIDSHQELIRERWNLTDERAAGNRLPGN